MPKPPRVWMTVSPAVRALVPAGAPVIVAPGGQVPLHRTTCSPGAELAGPWLLRVAVRLPGEGSHPALGHQACRWLGAVHLRWLRYMGVAAVTLHEGRDVVHWASFVARGPGDVLVGPRKITSLAQNRRAGETLVAAATLLDPAPWPLLCSALGRPEQDAAFLEASAVPASRLARDVRPHAWAAYLRSMLHLSLAFSELQDGTLEAE